MRFYFFAIVCFVLITTYVLFYFYNTNNFQERPPRVSQETGANRTKNVIFLVLDGVGAKYLQGIDSGSLSLNGVHVKKAELSGFFKSASAFAKAEQPFTETTSAHSIFYIGGDCNREWEDIKDCVDDSGLTTICDFYRSKGYICIMISEAGDFREARIDFDVAFYDSNFWDFQIELNSSSKELSEIAYFLETRKNIANEKKANHRNDENLYIDYSNFIIETDALLVSFMREKFPHVKFFLFSNAKGADLCGHRFNVKSYISCIEGLNNELQELLHMKDENTVFFITADHGMIFDCVKCKGYHAKDQKNIFASQIPFIYAGSEKISLRDGTAYDIMPTVFSISGFDYACSSMRYCEGNSLVVKHEAS
ncbi:MAG: hypothetical protein N3F05_02185 [Candidatus Diapherotrites archaeon]|nr:hypothetical protein [Candidatus Diapherotrites archaeon]